MFYNGSRRSSMLLLVCQVPAHHADSPRHLASATSNEEQAALNTILSTPSVAFHVSHFHFNDIRVHRVVKPNGDLDFYW